MNKGGLKVSLFDNSQVISKFYGLFEAKFENQ